MEFEEIMNKRNAIDEIRNWQLTKKELLDIIEKNFPDETVGMYGQIAQITTTTTTDGTVNQSVLFGKVLEL